jgi:hypothetical protein
MDTDLDPIVGNWYRPLDKGQIFRVLAFDEERNIVEIQHFDGDLEEMDASAWFDLEIEPVEAPEDWAGPLDGVEADEVRYIDDEKEWRGDESPDDDDDDDDDDEWDGDDPRDDF